MDNIGSISGKGLICCGDDKGSLWLYHQPQFGKDCAKPMTSGKAIAPTTRLMWPELQDDHLENSRKVPLGNSSIVFKLLIYEFNGTTFFYLKSNHFILLQINMTLLLIKWLLLMIIHI